LILLVSVVKFGLERRGCWHCCFTAHIDNAVRHADAVKVSFIREEARELFMFRSKSYRADAASSGATSGVRRYAMCPRAGVALCFCLALSGNLHAAPFVGSARVAATDVNAADHDADRVQKRFERYLAHAERLLQRYGYAAVATAVMAEGVGIPTPGQTLLMAGALEASKGRLNIAWLLFVATAAATAGNSMGYVIGRWGGRAVLKKLRVNTIRQQRFDEIFQRYGGLVVLLGRFVDGFRQLSGIIAGVTHMPWWRFTLYNVGGAILWTCAWGLGTYYLRKDIHIIAAVLYRHRWLLYALGMALVSFLLAVLLRSRSIDHGSASDPS
jgi:membrane protein DedA with SNARE-associated domain